MQLSDFYRPIIYICGSISGSCLLVMLIVYTRDWITGKGFFENSKKENIIKVSTKAQGALLSEEEFEQSIEETEQSKEESEVETDTPEKKFLKRYRERGNQTNSSFQNKYKHLIKSKDKKRKLDIIFQEERNKLNKSNNKKNDDAQNFCHGKREIIVSTANIPKIVSLSCFNSTLGYHPAKLEERAYRISRWIKGTVSESSLASSTWNPHCGIDMDAKSLEETNERDIHWIKDTDAKPNADANKRTPFLTSDATSNNDENKRIPHWIEDTDTKLKTNAQEQTSHHNKYTDTTSANDANKRIVHWIEETNSKFKNDGNNQISNWVKDADPKFNSDLNKQNSSTRSGRSESLIARLDDAIHLLTILKSSTAQDDINQVKGIFVMKNPDNDTNCCKVQDKDMEKRIDDSSDEAVNVRYLEKICKTPKPNDIASPKSVKIRKKVKTYLKGLHEYRHIDDNVFHKNTRLMDDLVQYWKDRENSSGNSHQKTSIDDS